MEKGDFAQAFLTALKDPEIRSTLGEIVGEQVKNEIILLRKELKEKNAKIERLERRIDSLESDNDTLEQYTRRNSLRIFGLPEEEAGEDTAQVALTLINQTMKVEPPITSEDLDRAHRIGKKGTPSTTSPQPSTTPRPRAVIIKFATYRARQRVMAKRKSLQKTKVFINEDLTRVRSTLLYKARTMKRQGVLQDAWTHDGALVVKDNNNKIHSARSMIQFDELMNSLVTRPTSS